MTRRPPHPRFCALASAALLLLASAGAPAAAPPAPQPGIDYRVVLAQGAGRPPVEIRRRAGTYRHEILSDAQEAVILYDPASREAVVIDGGAVYLLELAPSEIGGFDAAAMMRGAADGEIAWARGPSRSVAGAGCTEHVGTATAGGLPLTGRFCVTPEGIVLAIAFGGPGQVGRHIEATELEIGPQPADLFERPPDLPTSEPPAAAE